MGAYANKRKPDTVRRKSKVPTRSTGYALFQEAIDSALTSSPVKVFSKEEIAEYTKQIMEK